ncbi:helix-turn-helix transcriptional regulator [bacterium]|nr:helix-turn-helix transcriptional regulator [bacterium]
MIVLKTPQEMAVDAATRFKEMRKAKKIKLKDLSKNSGVPYSTIRRFESSGEISFLSLVKIVSTIGEDEEIANLFTRRIPASIEEIIRENLR